MKKIGILLFIIILLISCGKSSEVKELEKNLLQITELEGDELIEKSRYFIVQLVAYEQIIQSRDPKKLDIELLEESRKVFTKIIDSSDIIKQNIIVRVNYATLSMLIASYYKAKSDILKASEAVQDATIDFDILADKYPEDIVVRAFRGINYSYLPEIFAKSAVIASDYNDTLQLVMNKNEFTQMERGILKAFLERGLEYYEDEANMVTKINKAQERLK